MHDGKYFLVGDHHLYITFHDALWDTLSALYRAAVFHGQSPGVLFVSSTLLLLCNRREVSPGKHPFTHGAKIFYHPW